VRRPIVLLALLLARPAFADDKTVCAEAYEGTQEHHKAGKLTLARAQADTCVAACPEALASDCRSWREQIVRDLPSVVLEAKPAGGVRVTLVGQNRDLALDGTPIELDPGEYRFRFERGGDTVDKPVTLQIGERRRVVRAVFEVPVATTPKPVAPPPPAPPPRSDWPYVVGALGLAGLVTGAALGVAGHLEASHLRNTCRPNCDPRDVDSIRTQWLVGGVAAAAGAATLGVAYLMYSASTPSGETVSLGLVGRF
jgi:hypothetical protein